MRKLALALAFAALILGLVWLATRGRDATLATAGPAARAPVVENSTSADPTATPEPLDIAPSAPTLQNSREAVDTAAAAAVEQKLNDCVVTGRVVDEFGQPLGGLVVRLSAFKSWSSRAEAPRLPGPREFVGFEVTTDAAGAFRFEVPTPTNEFVSLSITPEIYRDLLIVGFTQRDGRGRAPLIAGENDLGRFELRTTGAIEGFVRDAKGAPIEGARLTLANDPGTTLQRNAVSDANGRYVMGHVAPGEFGVNCQAMLRLSQFKKPITVEVLRTTGGVDFELADAPTLSGVVVDEAGAPIQGAKLWCWPGSSGMGAGATSEVDGKFTVSLPQDEPYTLECKREGFEPFGVGNRDRVYAQGTKDIRVVMLSSARTRFRVVDARSGAPLENFGVSIYRENYSEPPRATVRNYPGGEVELAAAADLDKVAIHAPGFQINFGPVTHDTSTEAVQTVRLKPTNLVRGRVLREGEPVAGVLAVLEQGRPEVRFAAGEVTIVKGSFQANMSNRKSARCDAGGRFVFEGVADGMCRVIAEDGRGALGVSPVVELAGGKEHDFGDLSLNPGGVVVGRVLVPPGRALDGVEIALDAPFGASKVRTDETGAFRFDGVRPGEHHVQALERPGQHMASERVRFELAEGATHELELDLSALGVGRVSITVTLNGQPLSNANVSIVPLAKVVLGTQLGKTDASGRVAGWVRASGPAVVEVQTTSLFTLRNPAHVLDVVLDCKLDERVDFAATTLSVRLPAGVSWPEQGQAQFTFLGPEGRLLGDAQLLFNEGALVSAGATFDPTTASIGLELVPLGAVTLEFALTGPLQIERSAADPNVAIHRPNPLLNSRVPLQLTAGARNEVLLR